MNDVKKMLKNKIDLKMVIEITGLSEEELLKMAEISRKHDVLMITDEVHCDIIRKNVEFKPKII